MLWPVLHSEFIQWNPVSWNWSILIKISSLWIHIYKYYPEKIPSMMPSTGPNICPTCTTSPKPSNLQPFQNSELLKYFACGYSYKYKIWSQVFTISYSLLIFHIMLFLDVISKTPTYYKNKHKKTQYIILSQSFLLILYVLNISKRGRNCTH